jgi:hypothetical protein
MVHNHEHVAVIDLELRTLANVQAVIDGKTVQVERGRERIEHFPRRMGEV